MPRLWEIRLVDGTSVLVEVSKDRNLATELEQLPKWRWFRAVYFQPTPDVRVQVKTVSVVQPYEPEELKRKLALHNPQHPQRQGRRRTIVTGFAE